jgi:predicted RNA-binding Zn ribbon-like protein
MSLPTVDTVPLVGGHIALDLLNTVERLETDAPVELLVDWPAVTRWAERAGVAGGVGDATEVARIRSLREALRAVLAGGSSPAIETLRAAWLEALGAAALAGRDGLAATWPDAPAAVRHRLAAAAFALLADPDARGRVRRCGGEGCGGVFLDTTRNGSRRFCSTEGCGNRERVRRHRARRA